MSSWVNLVFRAASQGVGIWELLPQYSSLAQPPDLAVEYLEFLVQLMQSTWGHQPVTDDVLRKEPWSFLSWLHLVLKDFEAAQDTARPPRLFTMMPQSSNNTNFVKISTTGLHKSVLSQHPLRTLKDTDGHITLLACAAVAQ